MFLFKSDDSELLPKLIKYYNFPQQRIDGKELKQLHIVLKTDFLQAYVIACMTVLPQQSQKLWSPTNRILNLM